MREIGLIKKINDNETEYSALIKNDKGIEYG